jgi:hypothetical protein
MENNNMSCFSRLISRCKPSRNTNDEPYILIRAFEETSEKECGKFDRENQKKYDHLISKALKAHKSIKRTGLTMSLEVPPPPHPCNRDRYIIWKKRNISKKVIPQSDAVYYLTTHKYILGKHYEAYQAIDLVNELKKKEGTLTHEEDHSKEFNNVYNNNDKNIFRRRSMYGLDRLSDIPEEKPRFYPDLTEEENTNIPVTPMPFPLNTSSIQNRIQPSAPSRMSPMSPMSPNCRSTSPCDIEI